MRRGLPGMSRRKRVAFFAIMFGLTAAGMATIALGYYTVVALRFFRQSGAEYGGTSFIQDDPEIGYVQRPSVFMARLTPPAFELYSDSRGCRVQRAGVTTPEHVDLLAIGGSFTWGFGVAEEATFVERVARQTNLAVCNAAVPAYGTTSSLLLLRRFSDLEPGIVVYGYMGSHVKRALIPCASSIEPFCRSVAFVDFDAANQPFIHRPLPLAPGHTRYLADVVLDNRFGPSDVYWAIQRDLMGLRGTTAEQVNAQYVGRVGDATTRERVLRFLFDQLVQEVDRLKATLIVVYLPVPGDNLPLPSELRAALAPHEAIRLVDLTTAFADYERQHGPKSLRVTADDPHPNATAHRLISETLGPVVAAVLAERQPLSRISQHAEHPGADR